MASTVRIANPTIWFECAAAPSTDGPSSRARMPHGWPLCSSPGTLCAHPIAGLHPIANGWDAEC